MTNRIFALIVFTFPSASWSQETPPAVAKPAEAAKEAAPKFSATLLLIKSDWSQSPHAKQIETELREALKDASVPKDLLEQLPASGPEILFGPQTAALFTEQHYAELMAWLKAKDLIVSEDTFVRAQPPSQKVMEAKALETAKQWVPNIDANRDGVLTKNELLKWGGEYYQTADLDKNDIYSLEELAAHIVKQQRSWSENTIKLSKDESFIDLPKAGTGNRPFVKSRAELLWRVYWGIAGAIGADDVAFSRQLTVRDQVRGQEEPSEGKLVDNAYANVHIKEGRFLVMNAFPVSSETPFRQASRVKGFEAVVIIGRDLTKTPAATPRVHPPDWIDDRGDFGHEPQLSWSMASGPRPSASAFSPYGPSPSVNQSVDEFKFNATFLLLKSDWSAVPDAKEIESELREALKDVPVPKELLDKLPASGSQILFGGEAAAIYEPRRFAELTAWLKSRGLLVSTDPFPPTTLDQSRGIPRGMKSKSTGTWTARATKGEQGFVDLSWITKPAPQPFVEYKPEVSWTIQSFDSTPEWSISISSAARTMAQARGEKPKVAFHFYDAQIKYPFPAGGVAVTNAFGSGMERAIRGNVRRGGVEAFIVVTAGDKEAIDADAKSQLNLPDKVVTTRPAMESTGATTKVKNASDQEAPSVGGAPTKIISLKHAAAPELRDVILQLAPSEVKLAVNERTNAIIVSGPAEQIEEVEALVLRLDEPNSAAEDGGQTSKPTSAVAELRQQYADAEREAIKLAKESKPAKEKLRAVVAKAFELRQKLLRAELAEFRQRTERIEQSLQQRQGIKQQIIERRVEDLLKPGLQWEEAEASPAAERQ